ncbi:MAG TPA: TIM44-like domain-containing protein [Stellaceae bacterium]|nr:TIM44-like domain-containing protein [Stellaceae bacterium]
MSAWRTLLFALLCALLALSPSLADARAGGTARSGGSGMSYSSQGSMGSRTYTPNGGQAIQRSTTPQSQAGSPYSQPGFMQSHPFLTGLFGAFVGSWIGSLLFPHWGMGYGFGGMIGSLFTWLIIIWLVAMLFRMFRRRGEPLMSPSFGGMGYQSPNTGYPSGYGGYGGAAAPRAAGNLAVNDTDYSAFEAILKAVQGAWSKGDLATLRHYVTPEMLSYFSEQLAGNSSQGVENHVDNVEFIKGDVREAWDEGNLQYATALLNWRANDYTTRAGAKPGDPGYVVEGDPQRPSEAQELWTFARSPGGHWLLSAIQQV